MSYIKSHIFFQNIVVVEYRYRTVFEKPDNALITRVEYIRRRYTENISAFFDRVRCGNQRAAFYARLKYRSTACQSRENAVARIEILS